MKNTITTNKSNQPRIINSTKNRVGMMALIAFFVCSFAVSASAGSWTLVDTSPSGSSMFGIRVGSGELWGRDISGNAYQYNSTTNTLEMVTTSPTLIQLTVGQGKSVWALDNSSTNNIYYYDFTTKAFVNVPGYLTSIGAGAEGVWGVNSASGHAYVYNTSTKNFEDPPHGEPSEFFESISVGAYGIGPWGLDSAGNAWLFNTRTGYFDETNGVLASICVGNGEAWGITSAGTVWMYDPTPESWIQPDTSARLTQISLGGDSNVYGVNSSGQVYRFNPNPKILRFQLVSPQPPEAIHVIRSGGAGVFALAASGNVYKFN